MERIKLNKPFELQFFEAKGRLHMMSYKDGQEYHCRKESRATLRKLIEGSAPSVGKYALVLRRVKAGISISYKDLEMGVLPVTVFEQAIESLNNKTLDLSECR